MHDYREEPQNHPTFVQHTRKMRKERFTAILEKEGDMYVALCPELDIASQGSSLEEARQNLVEAVELFLECADGQEVSHRLSTDRFITHFEVQRAA